MTTEQTIVDGIVIGGAGGAVAGISILVVNGIVYLSKKHLDKRKVHNWLLSNSSDVEGQKNRFRTTRTIASHVNLTEDRVRYICSIHPKIMLAIGTDKELWSIYLRQLEPGVRQL